MKKQTIVPIILSLFVAACGEQRSSYAPAQQESVAAAAEMPMNAISASAVVQTMVTNHNQTIENKNNPPTEIITHTQATHRPFVITADLRFRTDDVRKTAIAIEQLAVQQGGFVVSNETHSDIIASEQHQQTDGMLLNIERYISRTHLIVRIPREKAQNFLHALQPHITLLEQQNYQAQDIFADMQREILTAQREQEKAKALNELNQQATPKTANHSNKEHTLENQFAARAREDEAKIQHAELKDKVDYATINLDFRQPESVMKSVQTDSSALVAQHRPPVWASIQQAFVSSMQILFVLALFLLKTWFVWLGLAAAFVLYRKRERKNQSHKNKE